MTREEAISIIRKMLTCTDLSVRANLNADMVDACHMAIKALEQEPVIDKIKAEIRKKMKFNSFNEGYVLYDDITEVLDKYKAESEK